MVGQRIIGRVWGRGLLTLVAMSSLTASCIMVERSGGNGESQSGEGSKEAQIRCQLDTEEFLDALRELDSRLEVGVQLASYLELVGDAQAAFDRMTAGVSDDCREQVGIPGAHALNAHIVAGATWNRCIQRVGCDLKSIDPKLQKKWSLASRKLAEAESGLDDVSE
jgi:hypothetical protein